MKTNFLVSDANVFFLSPSASSATVSLLAHKLAAAGRSVRHVLVGYDQFDEIEEHATLFAALLDRSGIEPPPVMRAGIATGPSLPPQALAEVLQRSRASHEEVIREWMTGTREHRFLASESPAAFAKRTQVMIESGITNCGKENKCTVIFGSPEMAAFLRALFVHRLEISPQGFVEASNQLATESSSIRHAVLGFRRLGKHGKIEVSCFNITRLEPIGDASSNDASAGSARSWHPRAKYA